VYVIVPAQFASRARAAIYALMHHMDEARSGRPAVQDALD
jgi:hypothetical protein